MDARKGTANNPIPKNWKTFSIDQVPNTKAWLLTPLFKLDEADRWRIWQVGFDGEGELNRYSGLVDGVITPHPREIELNQSGRDLQEQALLQARSEHLKQFRKEGYRPAGVTLPKEVEPALSNIWLPTYIKEEMDAEGKTKKQKEKLIAANEFPVDVEEKIDGVRLLFRIDDQGKAKTTSRNNLEYTSLGHITDELGQFMVYLPAGTRIDGEVWKKGESSSTIAGALRRGQDSKSAAKARAKGEKVVEAKDLKYYIFDLVLPEDMPFEDRQALLENAYARYIEDGNKANNFVILRPKVANNEDEILAYLHDYISQGYEGIIIRKLAGPVQQRTAKKIEQSLYKPGYSNNMLKYKLFKDEEGTIIGVEPEKGTHKDAAKFKVRDPRGNILGVPMSGPLEDRKEWLRNPKSVIGKQLTYRFQEESEYGVPRFAVGVVIRDYE